MSGLTTTTGASRQVSLLLATPGVDADAIDAVGRTALHVASHRKCAEIARLLLRHGADAQLATADGRDARSLALDQNVEVRRRRVARRARRARLALAARRLPVHHERATPPRLYFSSMSARPSRCSTHDHAAISLFASPLGRPPSPPPPDEVPWGNVETMRRVFDDPTTTFWNASARAATAYKAGDFARALVDYDTARALAPKVRDDVAHKDLVS